MKKALAIVLSAFILAGSGAGCGTAPRDTQTSAVQEVHTQSFDRDREITVTIAQADTAYGQDKLLRLIGDKFEYDYPNVTIEIVTLPKETAQGIARIKNGGIDLFEVDSSNLQQYGDADLFTDLAGYLANWDENSTLSGVSKAMSKAYDGEHYMLAHSYYTNALFFRKDWLLEKGQEAAPRYYDTWQEVAAMFTDASAGTYGLVMGGKDTAAALGDTMIWSTLGRQNIAAVFAGYYVQDESGKTVFSLPGAETALQVYEKLFSETMPLEALNWTQEEAAAHFAKGEAAMLVADSRAIPIISEELSDSQWAVARLPQGPEKIGIQSTEFAGWALAANSPEQDAAAAFLLYLSNTDNSTQWARETYAYPVHTDAIITDDYFSDTQFKGFVDLMEKVSTGAYFFAEIPLMYNASIDYRETANTWYTEFLSGTISASGLLSKLDNHWISAYQAEGQLWESKPKE